MIGVQPELGKTSLLYFLYYVAGFVLYGLYPDPELLRDRLSDFRFRVYKLHNAVSRK